MYNGPDRPTAVGAFFLAPRISLQRADQLERLHRQWREGSWATGLVRGGGLQTSDLPLSLALMILPSLMTTSQPLDRKKIRHPAASVGSILVHLTLVGGLWSAPFAALNELRLAGGRGSIELQATVATPKPAETPIIERILPTEVRVESDHTHVDQQTIWTVPPVELTLPNEAGAIEPHRSHPHEHPHRHEPHVHQRLPTAAALNVPIAPSNTHADASPATSIGHDETLPALEENPPPQYPAEAYRARIEGTTVLRVGVRSDGAVEFVEVARSSGHRVLDDAAVDGVRRWRFKPGHRDGHAASFVLRLPIVFAL